MKKVLFVSHDACRSGAPIILLNFLTWVKLNSRISFRILSKKSGDLDPEFNALAPLAFFQRRPSKGDGRLWPAQLDAGLRKIRNSLHLSSLKKELLGDEIGLVYSNTITNGEVLEFLSFLECPVITHVHELEYWIHKSGTANLERVKKYTTHYIVVSEATKRHLVQKHGIPQEKIEVVHGFIPIAELTGPSDRADGIRGELGIPDDAFILGSSGMESWRKGKDLFIPLALNVLRRFSDRPVHFVWLGGRLDHTESYQVRHDLHHAGIADRVHFVSHVDNPMDYYRAFDLFAMISREDPFPLVNLELAALGKPIVCFDRAGGTPEFVKDDAGFVVPYLDLSAMADKVIALAQDDELRRELGENAAKRASQFHDLPVGARKLVRVMERFL